jgi:hypothetical protein
MKTNSDAIEAVQLVNDAAAMVAKTLIETYKAPLTEEQKAASAVILDALKLTENGNLPKTEDLNKLQKKADDIKISSTFITKIKHWVKTFVDFVKSTFSKKYEYEVEKATTQVLEELAAAKKQEVIEQQTVTQTNKSSAEAKPLAAIFTGSTEQSEQFLQQEKLSTLQLTQKVNVVPNIPSPPSLPPPPPPPLSSPNMNPKTPAPGLGALLSQITAGTKLKSVADRVLPDKGSVKGTEEGVLGELAKVLAERNKKLGGDIQKGSGPSPKFAADAAEFAKAKEEEAERQARLEKSETARTAAALKKEQEAAKLPTAKTTPTKPLAFGVDGIPLPPPLLPLLNVKNPQLVANTVKKKPVETTKDKQFAVDADTIKKMQANLRPVTALRQTNVSGKNDKGSGRSH